MRTLSIAVSCTVILMLALATIALAADPFVGRWKLNLAKSKYDPGPPPKSLSVTIEAQDNGPKLSYDGVNAEGRTFHYELAPKFDGKDYPVNGNPNVDAMALCRTDPETVAIVTKKDGKELSRGRYVVSKDGRTMTLILEKRKNLRGEDVTSNAVFDKQ